MNDLRRHSIGIDIGGTNTDIGLVSADGKIEGRRTIKTCDYTQLEPYIYATVQAIRSLLDSHSVENIDGIGIGAPNANFYTGCIDNAPNLTIKGVLNLEEEIRKYIDVPVVVDNDANAAAYGELVYGGARGMQHIVMFTLGTGVGSGIVADGQLVHGTGAAGELGHAILVAGGRECSCGRNGCLETYCSARGIVQTYRELCQAESIEPAASECRQIGDLAHQGDPAALATWEKTGEWLGLAMANAVTFSAPQAIFLMGGPAQVGEPLMRPLRQSFEKNLLHIYRGTCSIQMSQLPANDVALLGAAALIYDKQSGDKATVPDKE